MTGCLLRISFLPLLVLLGIALFAFGLPGPWFEALEQNQPAAGIITGILAWFIWMCFLDIRRYKKYLRQLQHPVFQEGKPFVVTGQLQSEESPLSAPFSGEECLGYHYEIVHYMRMGSTSTKSTDYEGYALLPSFIKSNLGDFRILADPDPLFFSLGIKSVTFRDSFDEFKKELFNGVLKNAKAYIANTEFTETVDQQGSFSINKQIGKEIDFVEKRCEFIERTIKADGEYLITGVYSTNPPGVAPHPNTILEPFKIIPGGILGVLKILKNRWTGIGICSFLIGVVTLVYFLVVIGI